MKLPQHESEECRRYRVVVVHKDGSREIRASNLLLSDSGAADLADAL
jgi:hypothetical protein